MKFRKDGIEMLEFYIFIGVIISGCFVGLIWWGSRNAKRAYKAEHDYDTLNNTYTTHMDCCHKQ